MQPPTLQPLPPLPPVPPDRATERQLAQYRTLAIVALAERQTVAEANRTAVDLYTAHQLQRVANALNQLGAKFVRVERNQATRENPIDPWEAV